MVLLALILIVVAALVAVQIIRSRDNSQSTDEGRGRTISVPAIPPPTGHMEVSSIVTYSTPSGWTEIACPNPQDGVVLTQSGVVSHCDNQPAESIRIAVDPGNSKDCNQLQDVQNVSKHTCKSIFVNNHMTLEALTEYNQDSLYNQPTRLTAYYLDSGKGVVKISYLVSPPENGDELQPVLEQIVQSMRAK